MQTMKNYPLWICAPDHSPIWAIDDEGRCYWRGKEVETDDDARAAFLEGCEALRNLALPLMHHDEQVSFKALFPEGTRVKDVQDSLFFAVTCFDPKHPNYTPQYQKSAVKVMKDVLGIKRYKR